MLRPDGTPCRPGEEGELVHRGPLVALGYWKLAIILEGVYSRYAKGQYGKTNDAFEEFARTVERLAQAADEAVERLS